eukprot:gene35457-48407_t
MRVTGDIQGSTFEFDIDDAQRERQLEDGLSCLRIHDNSSCLMHTNCEDCMSSTHGGPDGCGWCFDAGHCLPKAASGGGDRCGTCDDFERGSCPLPCPGPDCNGHGECVRDSSDQRHGVPVCECRAPWDQHPPPSGIADCAVYAPPPVSAEPCPNQLDAFSLTVNPQSLVWAAGWLYGVWRAPAYRRAQRGVCGVHGRDDVPFRVRFGAPPAPDGEGEDDDFAFDPPDVPDHPQGTHTRSVGGDGAECLESAKGELQGWEPGASRLHYVLSTPPYRSSDVWVALRWPDATRAVDFAVLFAEVRCAAGFAGARCRAPLTRTSDRWFAGEENGQRTATVHGAVAPAGALDKAERAALRIVEVPSGTERLTARLLPQPGDTAAAALSLLRG